MAVGAAWMVGLRLAVRGLGLVSTLLLARLLTPEDFGLVALATTVAALLEIASEFNFDLALIRDQKAGRTDYDTAFTLDILKGLLIGLLLWLCAAPAAVFFEDPRLEAVFWVLAAASVVQGFWNIGIVEFRKNLEISREFSFQLRGKLAQFVVAIGLALLWHSYWALVVAILARRVVMLWLSFSMAPYRPRLSLARWHALVHFSKWILLNNLLTFVRERMDALIVGKLAGPAPLGLYAVAQEIADLPTSELAGPINRVIFPGFARFADDKSRLAAGYLDLVGLLNLVALPAAVGTALVAEPLVRVFLGEQWLEAVPLMQALCLFGIFRSMAASATPVYLALGRLRIEPALLALYILTTAPLLWLLIGSHGVMGAAWAVTAGAAVNFALSLAIVARLLALAPSALLGRVWRSLAATAAMAAVVLWLPAPAASPVLQLLQAVPLGVATVLLTQLALWRASGSPPGPESLTLAFLHERLGAGRLRWRG
ncbi:lipopolysaccharide biosynthesis protein [Geminicoccaceae bacterium 1502E]|nr:lipopolysaccharide biosynthesis protein [Geminicoccaceae bacterium 1502E]